MILRCILGVVLCMSAIAFSLPSLGQFHAYPSPTSCFANAWLDLIGNSQYSIDIAAYYWTLSNGSAALGGDYGRAVYQALIDAHTERGVVIRIVQQEPSAQMPDTDSQWLADNGIATVRSINWSALMQGDGILHTKLIIVDQRHVYLGSANMDWASLSQVKELGLVVKNCPLVADDARRMFDMYFDAAGLSSLPSPWPISYDTKFNQQNPFQVQLNNSTVSAFIAASPNAYCTPHRTTDEDALIAAIYAATESVCISVMDYVPATLYIQPPASNFFWGAIDDAIRAVAFNGIQVRLLISHWNYSSPIMFQYIASLNQLTNVQARYYVVPTIPNQAPYTRVNHAKYMVTDKAAYIGTNNWTGDYFLFTGGVSITAVNDGIRSQLQAIFDRDWNSVYASPANNTNITPTTPPKMIE